MPLKDKGEYNAYMKKKMKERYDKQKNEKALADFNGVTMDKTDDKEQLDLKGDEAKALLNMAKSAFKDSDTGEPDKIIGYIEAGIKYLPMVAKFVQGFAANMKAFNAQQQPPKAAGQQTIQAPEEWASISPMEKLKYKYTRPSWYAAGLQYDAHQQTGGSFNSAIDINKVDDNYTPPTSRRPQHAQSQGSDDPQSLAELSRKHPDPPLLKEEDNGIQRHDPALEKIIKEKQERNNQPKSEEKIKMTDKQKLDDTAKALDADNAKYITLAIDTIGKMPMTKFKAQVGSLDKLLTKYSLIIGLLPCHVKSMIQNTPDEELMTLFKTSCKDKFEWCEKNNHLDKIKGMFHKLKELMV